MPEGVGKGVDQPPSQCERRMGSAFLGEDIQRFGGGSLICKGGSFAFSYQNETRNCAWKRSVLSKEQHKVKDGSY